ncbi:MAG TPA: type II toxin-antitoxin system RelE/ParE family toxin [Zoogloea sp.]|nr:type II toxin-antitoxin system RelE/ParE family toxin [Bacillota bacterium]HQE39731.1 type II toxin-antitoxin system RelE/ParE family toxin [Zoogloea sp.]
MAFFYLTHAAKADLKEIGRYTKKQWGAAQRVKYLTMLDGCFRDLAAKPLTGQDCSDIRAGYRKYSAGSHVIFYRQIAEDTIEVVRILHGRMDTERHFGEP